MQAAWGIWEIAKVGMVRALRAQFAQKGLDPREFTIISMGGCGGLFNALIAQELGVRRVLAPELTSVLSAFGAANADVRRERSRGVGLVLPCTDDRLAACCRGTAAMVTEDLAADGIAESARSVAFEADLRFMRQQFELSIPCNEGFDAAAQRTSATPSRGIPTALWTGCTRARGAGGTGLAARDRARTNRPRRVGPNRRGGAASGNAGCQAPHLGRHRCRRSAARCRCDIDRHLLPGHEIAGPALLDGSDTTIWIPPRVRARR